ncbi:MAG: hypothetical protein AB1705_03085 [Verrucomicrobiota bacterium]
MKNPALTSLRHFFTYVICLSCLTLNSFAYEITIHIYNGWTEETWEGSSQLVLWHGEPNYMHEISWNLAPGGSTNIVVSISEDPTTITDAYLDWQGWSDSTHTDLVSEVEQGTIANGGYDIYFTIQADQ